VALKFYMDVHIPAAITTGLRRRNIDALTSQEDGTREVDDASLLQRSTELGRVLFSQDQDLLQIASECQRTEHSFLGLVFSSQQGGALASALKIWNSWPNATRKKKSLTK
jgi:predicted nuclease of predicted toxin-antitoxin system